MNTTAVKNSRGNSTRFLLAALIIGVGIIGGGWFFGKAFLAGNGSVQHATVFPQARALPDFELIDQAGQPFNRDSLRGDWSLLFFGFTHCPDICPATLQQLSLARKQLEANGVASLPEIVLISVDPARDNPAVLAAYVEYFGDGVSGVTGEPDELKKFTSPLGIHFEAMPEETPGRGYAVNHSTAVLLTNPQAELQAIFSTPHSVDAFVNDLPVIMTGP